MVIIKKNNATIIKNACDFKLSHIFDCGQCFRFKQTGADEYTGVAMGKALRISQIGCDVILHNTAECDAKSVWLDYFDFGRDYGLVKSALSGDECMDKAMREGFGIRILKQDLFETIISFIISQSNNIPRIKTIIETLCTSFGTQLVYEGKRFYSFPTPEDILAADISVLRAGYRDKYILSAAKTVYDNPSFLDDLCHADTETAKKMLMSMNGIGNKVSDCILLFGLGKTDSFPVDVWMRRIMEQLYFKKKCSVSEISRYAAEKFGEYSGIAQQYLFFYALNHKSELN